MHDDNDPRDHQQPVPDHPLLPDSNESSGSSRNLRRPRFKPVATPPKPKLYDYAAAAAVTGYSINTIRLYCEGARSTKRPRPPILARGIHWIMRRYRYGWRARRVRLITPEGIAYLMDRRENAAYRNNAA